MLETEMLRIFAAVVATSSISRAASTLRVPRATVSRKLMALLATVAFNYYFLPPVVTLTIADPQNWVALFAFLVTAIIASQLAERSPPVALPVARAAGGRASNAAYGCWPILPESGKVSVTSIRSPARTSTCFCTVTALPSRMTSALSV